MKFLVDVNLPKHFSYFNSPDFLFVSDIDLSATDTFIWNYALENNLIIITKDTDFYNRFLLEQKSPKVIHIQLGNCSLTELHIHFKKNWAFCVKEIKRAKLVILLEEKIEVIY
jgi:predicted nuclease of predicted toxin-antitoxin system